MNHERNTPHPSNGAAGFASGPRPLEGVRSWIVHVDGALVASFEARFEAVRAALGEAGIACRRDVNPRAVHASVRDSLESIAGRTIHFALLDALAERVRLLYSNLCAGGLSCTHGARDLLAWLRDRGIHVWAASTDDSASVVATLRGARLEGAFDRVMEIPDGRIDLWEREVLHEMAANRARRSDALVLAGTPRDARATHAAGMTSIGLTCAGYSAAEFASSTLVFEDPKELLAMLESRSSDDPLLTTMP